MVTFELDDPLQPVRRLFRFGNDFLPALVSQTGDLSNVEFTLSTVDGVAHVIDSDDDGGLALLAPGDSVTVGTPATLSVPAPRSDGETSAAYIARLQSLDNSELTAAAFAVSAGGVGLVLAGLETDSTVRQLPIVDLSAVGTETAQPGDALAYTLTSRNLGSVEALSVSQSAEVDGNTLSKWVALQR